MVVVDPPVIDEALRCSTMVVASPAIRSLSEFPPRSGERRVTLSHAPVVDAGGPAWAARGSAAYWRIGFALFLAGFVAYSRLYCVQPLLPVFADTFQVGAAGSSFALSLHLARLARTVSAARKECLA
jgi:MFS transporter, YNFM family, putative membrane transport protein